MWRKEDSKSPGTPQPPAVSTGNPAPSTNSAPSVPAVAPATAAAASLPISPRATACITQGIRIKGEIVGKEDLFVDGTLDGKLDLGNASVTVGPNGKVKADVSAREVIVRGSVEGKIEGTERVQVWNSGRVSGEVRTERLAIEDGGVLRGKVEAGKALARGNDARAASSAEKPKSSSAAASQTAVI